MKIHALSTLASLCLALTACSGDDSSTTDSGAVTTAPATGDDTAADTMTPGDDGADTTPADTAGETNACMPVEKTCPEACSQLYDCGVEAGCVFTGDADEKVTFTTSCEANPLCNASAAAVNECDCAATVMMISGLSTDFADSCENGIGAGGSSGSGGSGGSTGSTGA